MFWLIYGRRTAHKYNIIVIIFVSASDVQASMVIAKQRTTSSVAQMRYSDYVVFVNQENSALPNLALTLTLALTLALTLD